MGVNAANGENKMPPKEQIGARIPIEWKEKIAQLCSDLGISPSEWLVSVIGQALGQTDANSVNSIPDRVTALEKKFQTLSALLSR